MQTKPKQRTHQTPHGHTQKVTTIEQIQWFTNHNTNKSPQYSHTQPWTLFNPRESVTLKPNSHDPAICCCPIPRYDVIISGQLPRFATALSSQLPRSVAARPGVRDLSLHVHPSTTTKWNWYAAKNSAAICCRGYRSAAPRPKPPTQPEFLAFSLCDFVTRTWFWTFQAS